MRGREILVGICGCFEILTVDHIKMLQSAREQGDRLVVLLHDDEWMVRVLGHCYVPLMERIEMLMALDSVDSVVWFSGEVYDDHVDIYVGEEVYNSDIIDRIKRGETYTGAYSPDTIIDTSIIIEGKSL